MSRRVDVIIRSILAAGCVLGAAAAVAADPPTVVASTAAATDDQQTTPDQPTASGNGNAPLEEVVVTGTHVSVSTFNSPTPVTTIDSSTIRNLNITSVNDAVDLIPQNSNFTSAANVGLGNFNIGAQFANLRGLNPFFGTRTLTLVDGERFVPTSSGGAVDLNVVPSLLISRIDVVTGGASATYGTDAVAGVVNIILDNKFEGLKVQVDGGETEYHDGGDMHAGAAWGKSFADGKLHEVLGAEYEDAQGIGACGEVRPWCAQGYSEFTNSGYLTNGQPHYIIGPGGTSFEPTTGMLDSLSPAGYLGQFNNAGTALVPFNPGTYGTGLPFTSTQDGAGPNAYDGVTIRPPVIHYSLYSHTEYDVSNTIQASLDLSFSQRRATNTQASDGPGAPSNLIFPNNAYLTPSVASAMGGVPAFLYEDTADELSLVNNTVNNAGRVVFDLKGDIVGTWKWDGYYEWGENGTRQRLANDIVEWLGVPTAIGGAPAPAGTYDFFNWATNAVVNPANGSIQCAATIPGNAAYNPLAAGCTPLNLFGTGNASAAALAYAYRTLHEDDAYTQQVVSGSANGELFSGFGAGPVQAAIGAEYRHQMASVTHDLANQPWYDDYLLGYGNDYTGTIDVIEGFGEINAPLLKDLPLVKDLSLDLSVRETQNKNDETGDGETEKFNFPTWKFSVLYDPTDWLRLRADRSRDTRAPSFYELWEQTVDNGGLFGTVANPWKNPPGSALYGTPTDAARVVGGGYDPAVGLRPEQATTSTVGFVITPTGVLEGFKLSVDWWDIIIDQAIAETGSASLVVDSCYQGYSYYCQFIQGTPNGTGGFSQITGVENYNLNLGSYTVRGYDFESDYRLPFSRFVSGRADSLDFRILATYQYDQIVAAGEGIPTYNFAGQSGPTGAFGDYNTVPKWQGNAFVTYTNGPFVGVIQVRYIGSGKYGIVDSNTGLPLIGAGEPGYSTTYGASINNNTVASATYMNISLNYTLPFFNTNGRSMQVFGSLANVFNKWPPVAPGGNGYPTNPVYFDTFGRTWKAGVRLNL
jgi:iron complex outermembrane recepter protein